MTLLAAPALSGQVALVTGAGIRLGKAIATALAEHGCDVVIHCHSSGKEARALARTLQQRGRRTMVLKADLSRPDEAKKLASAAEKAFGRIDILVNSAAIFWPTPPEGLTTAELDTFLNVNLKSPFVLASELGRRMQRRGHGNIINISCVSAFKAWRTHLPYSISKAGINSLTVGLAKILGPEVRVNAIAPGTVLPPKGMPRRQLEKIRDSLPLKKIGSPDDVVKAVLYLCTADFVTGQILCVDGGRSIV
jgi:pteridine reductase